MPPSNQPTAPSLVRTRDRRGPRLPGKARIGLACCLAIAPATAQLGAPAPDPAWPGGGHTLELTSRLRAATGRDHTAVLGAARDAAGHFWLSVRRAPVLGTAPHLLVELDAAGTVRATYPQPAVTAASSWGLRDLAFDGTRTLYGGFEGDRVLAFDTITRTWQPARDVPLPAGLRFGVARALAFNPHGDTGKGSLWIGSWSSEHVEVSLAGKLLRRVPNVQPDTFGAAIDRIRGTLWWFGQSGSTRGTTTRVVATEASIRGTPVTGTRMLGDLTIPGSVAGGHAGGADCFLRAGRQVLLLVAQGDVDHLVQLHGRLTMVPSNGGGIGVDGDAPWVGNPAWAVTLRNSSETSAALVVGLRSTNVLLPPPFAPGSRLQVDPTAPLVVLPALGVNAGSARQPLPLPADAALAGVPVYLQWLEIGIQPLLSESAGVQLAPGR